MAPNWNPTHKCPKLEKQLQKEGHFAKVCRQKEISKRKVQHVTEPATTTIGGESDESESRYRSEKINRITDKTNT